MKVLVTGGAGYIGQFVTRALLRQGHHAVVVDNLSTGKRAAIGDADFLQVDITDGTAMRRAMHALGPDAVFHLAAMKSVADSWRQPERYMEVNVQGTAELLRAMADVGAGMLVYSGSCAIYGVPNRLPIDESQPAAPLNPYGETKWLAEQEIARAQNDWGLRCCALRYFNAAGAEMDGSAGEDLEHATNLVPTVMKAALRRIAYVPIYGTDYSTPDGTAIRDYVHVLDLAQAHLDAFKYLESGGESAAMNLGTGIGTSVRGLIETAKQVTGRPIPVREYERRPGDAPAVWADATVARQSLEWQPRYGIDDIVSSAWRWHERYPNGFE